MKVLITGGCGYVGTKLTEAVLARTAHDVDVLDTMWFGNRLPPHPRLAVHAMDVRKIDTLKDGSDVIGSRVRVKVVKNKLAPPFRLAEFDIVYGKGISKEGSLIDMGVAVEIVKKSGAWFTYEGDQLGQGRENAKQFLTEHQDVALDIERRVRAAVGITSFSDDEVVELDGAASQPAGAPAG